jgi:metal-dependent amidase/aminoacylase/carboxypeptidase family protein
LINAAQIIVSRNSNPFDPVVVSFTHVEAGTTWNVIPEEALLEGTIRAFTDEKLFWIAGRLEEFCRATAEAVGLAINFSWEQHTAATNNDPSLAGFAAETARTLGLPVTRGRRIMGGEDFAFYQQRIPGLFWTIGVNSPRGTHHPGFIADTTPLSTAAVFMAALARGSLERLAEKPRKGG